MTGNDRAATRCRLQ